MRVRLPDPLKRKQLKKGLEQLSEEGAVQVFFDPKTLERDPILGAVGVLQFDVVAHRLKAEYGVTVQFECAALQPRALGRRGNFDLSAFEQKVVRPHQVPGRRRGAPAGALRRRVVDEPHHRRASRAGVHRRRPAGALGPP